MLQELHITNFAIIDDIHMEFANGFNIITGETGAGKSILIDAVNIVLGAQADRDFIRSKTDKATVEAVFAIPESLQPIFKPFLDGEDIEYESLDELMLSREIRVNGRNVARVNGTVCKLATYREIGSLLIDILGQSEHLSLLKPRRHIYLLDRYAELDSTREKFTKLVKEIQQVRREMDALQQDEAAIARKIEMLEYQIQEIDTAKLKKGEDEALKAESNRLANSEQLLTLTHNAERLLFADEVDEAGAVELLEEASLVLTKLVRFDPSLKELAELADSVSIQAGDLADGIRHYGEKIDVSPGQLDQVEERLAVIGDLKRKYGNSIEEVLDFAKNAKTELETISHSEERLEALAAEEEKLLKSMGELGATLTSKRREAAARLAQMVDDQLKELRMDAARFSVRITQSEAEDGCYVDDRRLRFDSTGIDNVEFMLATNFGEPVKPLAKVASGGETSRSMLALTHVLAQADETPTLIFDEIDAGIGGRLGAVIGEKMWRLSNDHQVLCITHLAQLASFADIHFQVSKEVINERTITQVTKLDPAGRMLEIAEMLGSEMDNSRQGAHDLLNHAWQIKSGQGVKL